MEAQGRVDDDLQQSVSISLAAMDIVVSDYTYYHAHWRHGGESQRHPDRGIIWYSGPLQPIFSPDLLVEQAPRWWISGSVHFWFLAASIKPSRR